MSASPECVKMPPSQIRSTFTDERSLLTHQLVQRLRAVQDGVAIRRRANRNGVTIFTSLDTVRVRLDVLEKLNIGI